MSASEEHRNVTGEVKAGDIFSCAIFQMEVHPLRAAVSAFVLDENGQKTRETVSVQFNLSGEGGRSVVGHLRETSCFGGEPLKFRVEDVGPLGSYGQPGIVTVELINDGL